MTGITAGLCPWSHTWNKLKVSFRKQSNDCVFPLFVYGKWFKLSRTKEGVAPHLGGRRFHESFLKFLSWIFFSHSSRISSREEKKGSEIFQRERYFEMCRAERRGEERKALSLSPDSDPTTFEPSLPPFLYSTLSSHIFFMQDQDMGRRELHSIRVSEWETLSNFMFQNLKRGNAEKCVEARRKFYYMFLEYADFLHCTHFWMMSQERHQKWHARIFLGEKAFVPSRNWDTFREKRK